MLNKLTINVLLLILVFLQSCSEIQVEPSDEDWSFIVFADVRQGYGIYGQLANLISKIEPVPEFAVCLGDIMGSGSNEVEWESFWRYSKPVTDLMPLYIARGNHEGNSETDEEIYREQTGIPADTFYFSFSYAHSLFIILDSYMRNQEDSIGKDQFNWLKSQLDSVSSLDYIKNVFVFLHHPLYPQGKYKGKDLKNAGELHVLFTSSLKIRAVFVGHDHIFNKYIKDGIYYITTAGAGAPLYRGYGGDYYHFVKVSVYDQLNRLNIKTIGLFNEVIEDFDL